MAKLGMEMRYKAKICLLTTAASSKLLLRRSPDLVAVRT